MNDLLTLTGTGNVYVPLASPNGITKIRNGLVKVIFETGEIHFQKGFSF